MTKIEMNTDYPGMYATSDTGDEDVLTLTLNVSAKVRGESSFSSEYPEQEGATGTTFTFDAYENKASSVTLAITNNGNVDLTDVTLSSSTPTDWEVTFSESTIETLETAH